MELASVSKRCGDGSFLIPGLPENLVAAHIVTRLPWYTRPVCRAVSKAWRDWIDSSTETPELQLRSRKFQLPLLRGHFLLCTFDANIFMAKECPPCEERATGYYKVQWQDETYQIHRQWRKLPPLQKYLPLPPAGVRLVAGNGMAYVWSNYDTGNSVFKLDMGRGDWIWKKFYVPYTFRGCAVPFGGKIYLPTTSSTGSAPDQEQKIVPVYDMMTDKCEVNQWSRDNMGVLCNYRSQASHECQEELYSFVEHESESEPRLEILRFDACNNTWRTWMNIPFPEYQWSVLQEVELLNGYCFEPSPDEGTNTVWADPSNEVISWCNSSLHKTWVGFDYNSWLDGKCLEYLQFIHGSLYAVFCEDKGSQDDEGEKAGDTPEEEDEERDQADPSLFKRTLMKGTMSLEDKNVKWEEVVNVGCFEESYYLKPSRVTPIDHYTLMA